MHITYHGLSSFSINSKTPFGDVMVVIDPYENSAGLRFPRALIADVVLCSHAGEFAHNTVALQGRADKPPFVVDVPGEFEIGGMVIESIETPRKAGNADHRIFRFEVEEICLAHLGALDRALTDDEVAALRNVDVLFLPVGGGKVMSPTVATEVIAEVEPRIVVPMTYGMPNIKESFQPVAAFCKAMGVCQREDVRTLKLTKKGLPEEDMKVYILEKS
jgi:L-ascorbate metabolism protein UlaG (beta-lactamase superfamily)